ncbi:MAG: hypothetical protein KC496_16030 [Anaerolineae bacterium]|nr:hypothetical protein [Anaerolineae bacterium]
MNDTSAKENESRSGFWNNAIVGLLVMFTIPALLTVGGVWIVAQQGKIPGGTTRSCEQFFGETTGFRVEQYKYQAGLTPFAQEAIFATTDGGSTWNEIFSNTVTAPETLDCENNIRQLSEEVYLLQNQKGISITPDAGATWYTHGVCDDPRPQSGRCDADPLRLRNFALDATTGAGSVDVIRAVVDEYGLPITDNGEIRIADTYTLVTDDYGESWQLR